MADLRNDPTFSNAVQRARDGVTAYAANGVPDAEALTEREAGGHNLQGHAWSVIPLAVHFGRHHRGTMDEIRRADLDLNIAMDDGYSAATEDERVASRAETRHEVWDRASAEMRAFLTSPAGQDIVAETMAGGHPQTAQDVAQTYLKTTWGGGQTTGGAGNTVVKRTLKLLAHLQIA